VGRTASGPARRVVSAARIEWGEIGVAGRVAFAGVVISLAVAVVLGIWIPRVVRHHLLQARADLIASIGDDIAARGLVPVGPPATDSYEVLQEEIETSLLGGETVRVKLWTVDGTVTYSDDARLVGENFGLTTTAKRALGGTPSYAVSDLSEPAHALERSLGHVIEFFVPVHDDSGAIVGLFEVEQKTDALDASLQRVRVVLWLAIGTGVGLLFVFMAALMMSALSTFRRRRQQAESLLGALFRAQEEERRRIVGALHDDIGQTLFRLLYGLEGARTQLAADHPVQPELAHLADLTRDMDSTLRSELRLLHQGVDEHLGLRSSLEQIVDGARAESDLVIELDVDEGEPPPLGSAARSALVHAVREAVTNVRKHANATHVDVKLRYGSQTVVALVRDDGSGARSAEGLGLVTTRERLEALGGSLKVAATRGRGTTFQATIPIIQGQA
jgi:signal transduction histidine kinase